LDHATTHGATTPAHELVHEHAHELGFWRKYVFSVDHKVIGIQYAVTGLLFLLFGFTLMMLMRWQLAFPGRPIPLIGNWFGADKAPGGIMLPEFYNQLGAMHGTIMVFLGVVPLAVGGFGNFGCTSLVASSCWRASLLRAAPLSRGGPRTPLCRSSTKAVRPGGWSAWSS